MTHAVKTSRPPLTRLADTLAATMPQLDPEDQELALGLYRSLAAGEPVSPGALAGELGRDRTEVAEALASWPGVVRTDDGRVGSFWGLATTETPHSFRVDGRQLFTWCAWDALFIPELIGQSAEVESRSPASGEVVRLIVEPGAIGEVHPVTAAVSMLAPEECLDDQVITSFCHFVHFFSSASDGAEWAGQHEGAFLLSVSEAHELGRLVNRKRFDGILDSVRHDREDSP